MKKLSFMFAAVALAVGTQGASVNWTCSNVKDAKGNAISGVAYFINAATLSQEDFKKLDSAEKFNNALGNMYSYTPSEAGKYTVGSSVAVENSILGLSDSTAYSVYLAVFDTTTITDSSKYYLTETKDLQTLTGTSSQSLKWGSQSTASQAAGAWANVKPEAVPEPTSGLLMLLGMAGLALRRKRA